MTDFRNPFPTVDVLIDVDGDLVWIERKNEPRGWALPGGFIDYGESAEQAAIREASEETGLEIQLTALLYVYSRPDRDPRQHNLSVVFTATASGYPSAGDDAGEAELFPVERPPAPIAFDHREILDDYIEFQQRKRTPTPKRYLEKHGQTLQ